MRGQWVASIRGQVALEYGDLQDLDDDGDNDDEEELELSLETAKLLEHPTDEGDESRKGLQDDMLAIPIAIRVDLEGHSMHKREADRRIVGGRWDVLATIAGSNFNVGIVAVPVAFGRCGGIGGIGGLGVLSAAAYLGVTLLAKAAGETKARSYEELSLKVFGRKGYVMTSAMVFLVSFAHLIVSMIIMEDVVPRMGLDQSKSKLRQSQTLSNTLSSSISLLPLCLLKDKTGTRLLMLLCGGLTVAVMVMIVALIETLAKETPAPPSRNFDPTTMRPSILAGMGALSMMLSGCQTVAFASARDQFSGRIPTLRTTAKWSLRFSIVLIAIPGLVALQVLGETSATEGNVANSFDGTTGPLVDVFRGLLAALVVFACPMSLATARQSLFNAVFGPNAAAMTTVAHIAITVALWVASVWISWMRTASTIRVIMEVTGAMACGALLFVFPGVLWIRASEEDLRTARQSWNADSPCYQRRLLSRLARIWPFVLAAFLSGFGLVLMVGGVGVALLY